MNNQIINETETDTLFSEMRREKTSPKHEDKKEKFEMLPDGHYEGIAFIQVNKVQSRDSLNYNRSKYEIQITVTEGAKKGQTAYIHRVIHPAYLANKPAETDEAATAAWRENVKEYMKKTDDILSRCGVDTSDTDMNAFTLKIARNNRRRPVVDFTVKNGNVYVNRLVKTEDEGNADHDVLFDENDLPNGDDAPLI